MTTCVSEGRFSQLKGIAAMQLYLLQYLYSISNKHYTLQCHGRLSLQLLRSCYISCCSALKHTHPFNGPFSGTTRVGQYQKGRTNLDFTKARDSEWQWHQLGHMQVCISLQTDNHASPSPLSFLQAGCPSCRPTNSVKALKASKAL